MRKWLILSVALNVGILGFLLSRVPTVSGGGQYEEKGGLIANASSLRDSNPLNSNEVFYRFTVGERASDNSVAEVIFRHPRTEDEMIMRTYPEVVNWSEDGTEVRFVTPDIELTIKEIERGP